MYEDNLEKLKDQCGKKSFRHKINVNSPLLPFRTDTRDQTDFSRGFKGIVGEFSRVSFNKTLDENFNLDESINTIISNTNWDINKENEEYLKSFLESYLINDDSDINILHPALFLYLNKTEHKRGDNEKDIAIFFRDVFFKDINNFNDYFEDIDEIDNIIVKLIFDNISELEDEKIDQVYYPSLNFIVEVFKEDFEFIKNNYDFVINNLDYIFAYYYFYYCVQLVLKSDQPINVVDLSYLINTLKNDLKNMGNQQPYAYWRNLNNIALKYFVKGRGPLGHVLNIDKKFLYLITALCVKEEKIKLNDLFKEYERRGLFFDRYSKEKIVELLNTWNLIDKKSDSGDAQYVKQIL